ncbi:MAG: ribose-phosphate pyrophosphokinase 3, chloroplastic [Candidatus Moranbacteria bacterium GW2011_GWF1_35_5]|nr:MAG: ribose-phosphate pyrophosphokinase 3, chloroplastic [Candidatus Moranbacteria bacterium GW2011_GWF1_35_5]
MVSAIPLLKERIKSIENLAIAFPDDGAYKRFGKMFPEYPHIICNKVRMSDGEKIVTIKEGAVEGKHVIIIDDLVQTGGTLLECREVLLHSGAKEVSAYATHGVFPKDSWKNFLPNLFSHIWITDSCPDTIKKISAEKEFEILSLAPSIAEIIKD